MLDESSVASNLHDTGRCPERSVWRALRLNERSEAVQLLVLVPRGTERVLDAQRLAQYTSSLAALLEVSESAEDNDKTGRVQNSDARPPVVVAARRGHVQHGVDGEAARAPAAFANVYRAVSHLDHTVVPHEQHEQKHEEHLRDAEQDYRQRQRPAALEGQRDVGGARAVRYEQGAQIARQLGVPQALRYPHAAGGCSCAQRREQAAHGEKQSDARIARLAGRKRDWLGLGRSRARSASVALTSPPNACTSRPTCTPCRRAVRVFSSACSNQVVETEIEARCGELVLRLYVAFLGAPCYPITVMNRT